MKVRDLRVLLQQIPPDAQVEFEATVTSVRIIPQSVAQPCGDLHNTTAEECLTWLDGYVESADVVLVSDRVKYNEKDN